MTKESLFEILITDREYRCGELEFCKKLPLLYTNPLFQNHSTKYWRMCVPIIYAHWEGFVVNALRELTGFINDLHLSYSQVKRPLILLSNKNRFQYLKGNCELHQQNRFFDELFFELNTYLNIDRSLVTANSNLNFQQLTKMLKYFDLSPNDRLSKVEHDIDQLVLYRNHIAHGENSISVDKKFIDSIILTIIESMDLILLLIMDYANSECYKIES